MNAMQQELAAKIYPPLLSKILYFSDWKDPPNFFTMTRKERIELYQKFAPLSELPTNSNQWIWFGAYGGHGSSPRYNDGSVVTVLFEALIAPANGKKILPTFIKTRAEVNPFKFARANGMKLVERQEHYQNMTGEAPVITRSFQTGPQALIDACVDEMNDLFCEDVIDTKEEMAKVLIRNEHSEFAIAEAFKLSNKPWK